jgi:branched-chain amino acid transport system substrate-binding protein
MQASTHAVRNSVATIIRASAITCACLAAACAPNAANTPNTLNTPPSPLAPPASASAPTHIAVIAAETGSMSPIGIAAMRGAQLAITEHNRTSTLRFDTECIDTQSSSPRTAELARAAAARNTLGIGFTDSDPALVAVPEFTRLGKPFVVLGATDPKLPARCGAGTFLACFGDDAQAIAAADFGAARFGKRTLVIFDSRYEYTRTIASYFRSHMGNDLGGTVVAEFDLSFTPAAAIAPHLVAPVNQAEFIFVACMPEDIAAVLKSVRSALPTTPIIGGDSFDCAAVLNTPTANSQASTNAAPATVPSNRVWFTTHAWLGAGASPAALAFVDAYSTAYGTPPPNAFAALGYDTARLAIDARTRAGSDDPKAIAAALAATTNFQGITGTISYANGPVPQKKVWIVSVANGTLQLTP